MITQDLMKMNCNKGSSIGALSCVSTVMVDDVLSDASNSNCNRIEIEDSLSSYYVSPGGNNYFIPTFGGDGEFLKPFVDQIFENLDEGFKFYENYGRMGGFDVRKGTETKNYDGDTIFLKHYVCSSEGFKPVGYCSLDETSGKIVKRRRTVTKRCGCKAKVVLNITCSGKYSVYKFVEAHNHPLANENGRQFLRCSRRMTTSSRDFVFEAAKVNIGCSKAYSLMKEMVGGYSNIGATLRDFRNFHRDLKEFVGERDGQMLIDKFKVMQETCASFYCAFELDSEGHLSKIFWADAVGRRNFDIYGDAVSFDATFDTNKYNMIFAPFTGVDNHDRCVTFAACLLSKEDVSHFSWAFDNFVKAMGRNPVVIVTDQCPAMKIAIRATFGSENGLIASKHRLCMWHIMEKFPAKLGNRLCKETDFMEK